MGSTPVVMNDYGVSSVTDSGAYVIVNYLYEIFYKADINIIAQGHDHSSQTAGFNTPEWEHVYLDSGSTTNALIGFRDYSGARDLGDQTIVNVIGYVNVNP